MEKRKRKPALKRLKKNRPQKNIAKIQLFDLICRHPEILPVLDRHGISFCAGCFLTLEKTPEEAAAYHGAPNAQEFLHDLFRAMSKKA